MKRTPLILAAREGPTVATLGHEHGEKGLFNEVIAVSQNKIAAKLVAYFRLTIAHLVNGLVKPEIVLNLKSLIEKNFLEEARPGIWLDIDLNFFMKDLPALIEPFQKICPPDVLSIDGSCKPEVFFNLRGILPETKLALSSGYHETSDEEAVASSINLFGDINRLERGYRELVCANRKNIVKISRQAFDIITCSPKNLRFLRSWLDYDYQLAAYGIRDKWMFPEAEKNKAVGTMETLDDGADFVFIKSDQLLLGNPLEEVSAQNSQQMTAQAIRGSTYALITPSPWKTLFRHGAIYACPKKNDEFCGKLIALDSCDENGRNLVSGFFFNIERALSNPNLLKHFAWLLANLIEKKVGRPDVVLGMPGSGSLLAIAIGLKFGIQAVLASKEILAAADFEKGKKEKWQAVLKGHQLQSAQNIVIVDGVMESYSVYASLLNSAKEASRHLLAIACVINNLGQEEQENGPTTISIEHPSSAMAKFKYRQDDKEVAKSVAAGKIEYDPVGNWPDLLKGL